MTIALMILSTIAAQHSVTVPYRTSQIEARYSIRADIGTRTIGAIVPNRADQRRCIWKARMIVERQLGNDTTTVPRIISNDRELSGSRSGACSDTKLRSIEKEIAGRSETFQTHLAEVAEQDRTTLLAELDALYGTPAQE